jgi:hypothetical protein
VTRPDSTTVQLPSSGNTLVVTNTSVDRLAFIWLGSDDTVTADENYGLPVIPHTSVVLAVGSNRFLAASTLGNAPATLNIVSGQ